ncbi:hypothetical protein [Enterobacter sp. RIT418]|uniref:hypothetical protein n=1 Tax=Enterobacter sp. RIT418 TaxID=2202164 RepID=UPI000D407A34|nr:hypothetical protein [Enterobacter sp. RIT 418]RAU38467.1 hypothetical protein DBY73_003795 [Enterobacter sp. RIT 418]
MPEHLFKPSASEKNESRKPEQQPAAGGGISFPEAPASPRLSRMATFVRHVLQAHGDTIQIVNCESDWQQRFSRHFFELAGEDNVLPAAPDLEWLEEAGELSIAAFLSARGDAPEVMAARWYLRYLATLPQTGKPAEALRVFSDLSWAEVWREIKQTSLGFVHGIIKEACSHIIQASPTLGLISALIEQNAFDGAVRFILGLGVRRVMAIILHTLSLMPEGSPVRAVLSLLSDAARAEAEWTQASLVLLTVTALLAVAWRLLTPGTQPDRPVTAVGRFLVGIPELLTSLHNIINLFSAVPHRQPGSITSLYADPADISGRLPGNTQLLSVPATPVLQIVRERWTPGGQQTDGVEVRGHGRAYEAVQAEHARMWSPSSPAMPFLSRGEGGRQASPVVSQFLSRELNKADKAPEAFRGVHCLMRQLSPDETTSVWDVALTGWLSQGTGRGIQAFRWTTRMEEAQKTVLDRLLRGEREPGMADIPDTALRGAMTFLAGEPLQAATLPEQDRAETVNDPRGVSAEEEALMVRTDNLLTRVIIWSQEAGAALYNWLPPRLPFEPGVADASLAVPAFLCPRGYFQTAMSDLCEPDFDFDDAEAPKNEPVLSAEQVYIRQSAPALHRALTGLAADTGKTPLTLLSLVHISKWTDVANDLSGAFEQTVTDIRLQALVRDADSQQQTARYTDLHPHESLRLTLEGDAPDVYRAELNNDKVLDEVKQLLAAVNGWLPSGLPANVSRWMKTAPVAERLAYITAHERVSGGGNMTTAAGALNAMQTLQTLLTAKKINEVADVTAFTGRWLVDAYGAPADILQKNITVSGQAMMREICPLMDSGRERYDFSYPKSLWYAARKLPWQNERCDVADVGQHWKRGRVAEGETPSFFCGRQTEAEVEVGGRVESCNIQYPPDVENNSGLRQLFKDAPTPVMFRSAWEAFTHQWEQDPELTAVLVLRLAWQLNTRLDDLINGRNTQLTELLDTAQKAQLKAGARAMRLGMARPLFLKHKGTGRVADQLILLPGMGADEYFVVSLSGSTPVSTIKLRTLDFGDGSARYVAKGDYEKITPFFAPGTLPAFHFGTSVYENQDTPVLELSAEMFVAEQGDNPLNTLAGAFKDKAKETGNYYFRNQAELDEADFARRLAEVAEVAGLVAMVIPFAEPFALELLALEGVELSLVEGGVKLTGTVLNYGAAGLQIWSVAEQYRSDADNPAARHEGLWALGESIAVTALMAAADFWPGKSARERYEKAQEQVKSKMVTFSGKSIQEGEKAGAYYIAGEYYIPVEEGRLVRSVWDENYKGFRTLSLKDEMMGVEPEERALYRRDEEGMFIEEPEITDWMCSAPTSSLRGRSKRSNSAALKGKCSAKVAKFFAAGKNIGKVDTSISWNFVISIQIAAHEIGKKEGQGLMSSTRALEFIDFIGKDPLVIRTKEMLTNIPLGSRIAFVEKTSHGVEEIKHAMLYCGDKEAIGINNGWLTNKMHYNAKSSASTINLENDIVWNADGPVNQAGYPITIYAQSQSDLQNPELLSSLYNGVEVFDSPQRYLITDINRIAPEDVREIKTSLSDGTYNERQDMIKNNFLHGSQVQSIDEIKVVNMLSVIDSLSAAKFRSGKGVFHGNAMSMESLKRFKTGTLIQSHQLTFFSDSLFVARYFSESASSASNEVNVIFEIENSEFAPIKKIIPAGGLYNVIVNELSRAGEDVQRDVRLAREGVIPPGYVFKVTDVTKIEILDIPYQHIKLKYVHRNDDIIIDSFNGEDYIFPT